VKIAKRIISWVLPDIPNTGSRGNPLIEPAPNSPEGMRFPEGIAVSGRLGWHALKLIVILPYVSKTMYYARKCVKSVKKNPLNAKKKADKEFFRELETYARKLDISAIGYTKAPREYIFVLLFKNTIVLTMEKKIKNAYENITSKKNPHALLITKVEQET